MTRTPGPWTYRRQSSGDFWVMAVANPNRRVMVAETLDEDDARLIAAAPELMAALNGVLGFCQLIASRNDIPAAVAAQINPREGRYLNPRIVAAREAIATAEGR